MTIPRSTPQATAIYDAESELLKGAYKLYPKLKAFADARSSNKSAEKLYEYGYCLKGKYDRILQLNSFD